MAVRAFGQTVCIVSVAARSTRRGERAMDRRQQKRLASAVVRVSVFLLIVAGVLGIMCTPLVAGEPKHGGTLIVGLAADISHFGTFHALGYEAIWALQNIHSGLV